MRAYAIALMTVLAAPALGAEVYRSVDENGVVKFSDRPDQGASERIVVVTAAPAVRSVPRPAPAGNTPAADPVTVAGGEMPREPTPAERADERQRNCEIATQRAERYRNSRRLYRELPNGEREYLDDAQIDAAKADAEADVAAWCG